MSIESKFLETLGGHALCHATDLADAPGRSLPAGVSRRPGHDVSSFLEFCYTPDKAVEVTLQPIRRFGFDAAIIFSDILVVPDALGQKVWFEEGEGPKLEALTDPSDFGKLVAGPPARTAGAGLRGDPPDPGRAATRDGAAGVRRRALHAGLLHDRGQRQP